MKNLPAVSLLAASLVVTSTSILAEEATQLQAKAAPSSALENQRQGIAAGTLIGAIVAGPVGAVIGAGFGGTAGWGNGMEEAYQDSQSELEEQKALLSRSQVALKKVQSQLRSETSDHQQMKPQFADQRSTQSSNKKNHFQLGPLLKTLAIDFHFQTNSAVVEPHYYPRLKEMTAQLKKNPGLHLHLTGYADQRGSHQYNLKLAKNRTQALSSLLTQQGLNPQRIRFSVKGEEEALSTHALGLLPFDRKVEVRFEFSPSPKPITSRGLIL